MTAARTNLWPHPAPASAGVGFKPQHFQAICDTPDQVDFLEVHPENYMVAGGPKLAMLDRLRRDYPLSLHGVGASLGSVDPVDPDHLRRFRALVDRYQPFMVSEHLSWSRFGTHFHADLLPLPMTEAALDAVAENVERMQEALGRKILMENPSTYLEFNQADMDEPAFFRRLVQRTGCGILLDVNNVFVCAQNHGLDATAYLNALPGEAIGEIHMAGHAIDRYGAHEIRIDTHGAPVCDEVWQLYQAAIARFGPRPTLLERDDNLPGFDELAAEARHCRRIMEALHV